MFNISKENNEELTQQLFFIQHPRELKKSNGYFKQPIEETIGIETGSQSCALFLENKYSLPYFPKIKNSWVKSESYDIFYSSFIKH